MNKFKDENKSFEDEDFTNIDSSNEEFSENDEENDEIYSDDESIQTDKMGNKKNRMIIKGIKKVNDDIKLKRQQQQKQKNKIIFNVSGNY